MKIRTGFVSNSSSSSFICCGLDITTYKEYVEIYDKLGLTLPKDSEEIWEESTESLDFLVADIEDKYKLQLFYDITENMENGGVIYTDGSIYLDDSGVQFLDIEKIKMIDRKCSEINNKLNNKVNFSLLYFNNGQ